MLKMINQIIIKKDQDNSEDIDENEDQGVDDSQTTPIKDYAESYQQDNNQEQKDNQEDELLIGQPKVMILQKLLTQGLEDI